MTKTATYLLKLLSCFCFVIMMQSAGARIFLSINGKKTEPAQLQMKWVFDGSGKHNFSQWLIVQPQAQSVSGNGPNMSYEQGQYWISIDLDKLPVHDSVVYLEVRNPHINYLGAWLVNDNAMVKEYELTGDHRPFDTRNIYQTQFIYKIELKRGQNLKLVLMVDKRNEQLHLPLNFFNDRSLINHQRNNNLLAGLFLGVLIFILLFTLFLYFNIREKLYIYYALYVLMITGYIFSDMGLSFMFLYPEQPAIADFSRPFTFSLAPIFYILFSRSLLQVKKNFPRIYRFTNGFLIFFVACFILGFGVPNAGPVRTFWLLFMQFIMVFSIVPVFVFSIMSWRRGMRYASYIVFASVLFTVCTQVYMQYLTGNLPHNVFTSNAVNIGFSIELVLLTLALSIRFKNYKQEADDLQLQLNRQQENIFKNISQYQEQEMKRLSGILHDSIGAGLSSIKYNLEAVESYSVEKSTILQNTIDDVGNLTDEIRNISHTLSPLLLQQKGLVQGIKHLIQRYNRTGKVSIWIESIGSLQSASFQNEILVFRIVQELLQNIIKHAGATEVMVQLIIEPELISVLVEDNGKGFNLNEIKEGLGFTQIKALVTFVKGQFEVRSEINKGCSVSIEFPTIPNESTDKSVAGRRSPYVS